MRRYGMNSQDNREHNRAALLSLVRNHGPISRSELARLSGLSKPVVTEIVDSLINANLVYESYKAKSGVGRRPVMLKLNQDSLRILGIDLARTRIEFMVTDLKGNALKTVRLPLSTENEEFSAPNLLDILARTATEMMQEFEVIGIGIAHPLPSAALAGRVGAVQRSGWYFRPQRRFPRGSTCHFVGNGADVAALYENGLE